MSEQTASFRCVPGFIKTLRSEVSVSGRCLHNGLNSTLTLRPRREPGICYRYKKGVVPAGIDLRNTTTVSAIGGDIYGVEHLLGALYVSDINSVEIELDGAPEVPCFDGSALEFTRMIERAGTDRAPGIIPELRVEHAITVHGPEGSLAHIYPHEHFCFDMEIDYPWPAIGRQGFSFDGSKMALRHGIIPARTFIRDPLDLVPLKAARRRLPGFEQNVLLWKTDAWLQELRWPDEPVRHKALDFIGDMYRSGIVVRGRFDVLKPGHALNQCIWDALHRYIIVHAPIARHANRSNAGARL